MQGEGRSLKRIGGKLMIVSDEVFPVTTFVACAIISQSSLVDETPWEGFMTVEFFLEDLSLGRKGKFRESLSLHFLLFNCLQLKLINVPKWQILGGVS